MLTLVLTRPPRLRQIPRLAAIRDRAKAAGTCRIVLVARVREPLSFYLSFWRWTIMGKQVRCEGARCAAKARGALRRRAVRCEGALPPTIGHAWLGIYLVPREPCSCPTSSAKSSVRRAGGAKRALSLIHI